MSASVDIMAALCENTVARFGAREALVMDTPGAWIFTSSTRPV